MPVCFFGNADLIKSGHIFVLILHLFILPSVLLSLPVSVTNILIKTFWFGTECTGVIFNIHLT